MTTYRIIFMSRPYSDEAAFEIGRRIRRSSVLSLEDVCREVCDDLGYSRFILTEAGGIKASDVDFFEIEVEG